MNRIHKLDESSIRQIAAGEVVERPASVIKELVENAIDAGGTRITIEVEGGGKNLIRISDDGCGMHAADALLALERHTTSKIQNASDLETLSTFGFRGEALPAIASVSKFRVLTKTQGKDPAVSICVEGSKLSSNDEASRAPGTTIEVKDLFFNIPARLKFLKSDGTEKGRILKTFEEIAIAHPKIAFEIKIDGKSQGNYPARAEALERVRDLWGEDFTAEKMVALDFDHPYLKITGWVSEVNAHQATKAHQLFYVNSRPIVSRSLTHALYESYRDALPVGRHPACAIFLELDPAQVDVNVHPAKREVRFRNEPQIYEALMKEIRARRSKGSAAPSVFNGASNGGAPARDYPRYKESATFFKSTFAPSAETHSTLIAEGSPLFRQAAAAASPSTVSAKLDSNIPAEILERPIQVLAQFQALYVLAQQGENLIIVDQHAAQERILYEKFRAFLESEKQVPTQPLLFPILWNVSLAQSQLLTNLMPMLESLGFKLETFGEKTFRIAETPAFIKEANLKEVLDEILKSLETEKDLILIDEERIMTAACRAAIKANDPLTVQELEVLIKDLSRCSNPHTCPHGRPVTLVLSRTELDKKFGRI